MAKRVLFFRTTLADGGADRVTITLLEQLDRTKWEPMLSLLRREGPLADRVPRDVPVFELGVRRLAVAVPALARAIRRSKPDVVMCTAGGANVVAVAAHRLARSRARLVLSERNALRRRGREWIERIEIPLKRRLYPLADVVTAVSDGVGQELVDLLHLPRNRVRVVYNPIVGDELESLAAAPVEHAWLSDRDVPVVIAVGRLVAQKDYPTMLAAFARLRSRMPVRLVVLGKGPDREALVALAAKLGLASDVEFVGFDPNPFRWMARGALLLQSSVAEGLPGTLVQSMACGTPVVATDCNYGPREVVSDGIDGYLVPVGDSAALADRAERLLVDRALRERMGAAARISAKRYSIAASLARYEAALDGR